MQRIYFNKIILSPAIPIVSKLYFLIILKYSMSFPAGVNIVCFDDWELWLQAYPFSHC